MAAGGIVGGSSGQNGPHPGDAAGDRDEFRRVTALRGRTPPMPWPHVSRQIGKSEDYLRRVYGPMEAGGLPVVSVVRCVSPPRPAPKPKSKPKTKPRATAPTTWGAGGRPLTERVLLALDGFARTVADGATLGHLAEHAGATHGQVLSAVAALINRGLAANVARGGGPGNRARYALTPAGTGVARDLVAMAKLRGQG